MRGSGRGWGIVCGVLGMAACTSADDGTVQASATEPSTGPSPSETGGPTSGSNPPSSASATSSGTSDGSMSGPTSQTASGGTDDSGSTGGSDSGGSALDCTLAWSSGFENGFPGEWLDYDNGSWSSDGTMPDGRVSAWTIIDEDSAEPIWSGQHGYKGWIEGPAAESHRAYPGVHLDLVTPVVNTFWVYLDADYDVMDPAEWIHFGTWGNDDGMGGGLWALHTMSVRDRYLEFAHTEPFPGEYIGPEPRPEFPLGQWVRFTVYVHYEGTEGFVQVWQDGVAMLRASVSQLASYPGTNLTRAHWGMYASAETSQGTQYNDDIVLWTLPEPLADLETEPDCYLSL